VDRLMVVRVGLELQAIERDPLRADGDLSEIGPHLDVEAILVHPQVGGDVSEADKPPRGLGRSIVRVLHGPRLIAGPSVVDQKPRLESSHLCGALHGSSSVEVAELSGWTLPRPGQMMVPG